MKINGTGLNRREWIAGVGVASLLSLTALEASAQQHTWIAGTATPPNDPIALSTDYFAERVEALTDGAIVMEVHHGAALGGDRDLVETILQQGIQVATPGQALLAGWYKPAEIWIFPYLFNDVDHKDRVWDTVKAEYADTVGREAGLRPLVAVPRGPRMLSANKVVKTPADMEGMKVRVPETQLWLKTFERFGASPTPLPFPEVYQALRAGVIDGQDNPVSLTFNSGFFEVNTHLNLTEHMMQDNVIVVGEAAWRALTPELQAAVTQAATETELEFRKRLKADSDALLQKVKDAGVVVTEVDKAAFRKSVEGLEADFPHIQEWLEKIRAID